MSGLTGTQAQATPAALPFAPAGRKLTAGAQAETGCPSGRSGHVATTRVHWVGDLRSAAGSDSYGLARDGEVRRIQRYLCEASGSPCRYTHDIRRYGQHLAGASASRPGLRTANRHCYLIAVRSNLLSNLVTDLRGTTERLAHGRRITTS